MKKKVIKNNFRILEKEQYAYLQTTLKAPVKFEKDWPKRRSCGQTNGGGADGRTNGRTLKISEGVT